MEVDSAVSLVILVLQMIFLALIIIRTMFGKDRAEKTVNTVKKALELVSKFKHLGNIVNIAEDIFQSILSGHINEQQMIDLANYVHKIAGDI